MYSNTGGQASKSTPAGAMAKFAEGGKRPGAPVRCLRHEPNMIYLSWLQERGKSCLLRAR